MPNIKVFQLNSDNVKDIWWPRPQSHKSLKRYKYEENV